MGELRLWIGALTSALWMSAASARTVPACGGVMVSDETRCAVRLSVDCLSQCTPRRMLQGCATSMVPSCREVCTQPPAPVCTGDCGGTCEARCAVDTLVCQKGCASECAVDCGARCEDAADPAHCRAACEANCGHECQVQCDALPVDASCLEHCYQCCSGSCTAQANLDCQVDCQKGGIEGCQDGLLTACEAGCDADGALFCDGQFVAAGVEMTPCVTALKAARVPVTFDSDVGLDTLANVAGQADSMRKLGCNSHPVGGGWLGGGLIALLLGWRRRR